MERSALLIFPLLFVLVGIPAPARGQVRVKDVARIQGVMENDLLGYGLVVGLQGTGDRQGTFFTVQSVANMLLKLGINVPRDKITVKNVAAVMVTAKLPPFAKVGSRVDALVSSLGDATNLQGGTLLLTPLQGADGKVYAVAQGPVSIGGFSVEAKGTGERVQRNHPTVGRVPNGATVEREVPTALLEGQGLTLTLKSPDFTTAIRLAEVVNKALGEGRARAMDAASVRVHVLPQEDPVELVARLEYLTFTPDAVAKVVINERTGTIVMGSQVKISTVAISHGGLNIQIRSEFQVSQPSPFAPQPPSGSRPEQPREEGPIITPGGATAVVPKTEIIVQEERGKPVVLEAVTIGDLVRALNALGVTPRDLIAILQAIKEAGALQAELEIL